MQKSKFKKKRDNIYSYEAKSRESTFLREKKKFIFNKCWVTLMYTNEKMRVNKFSTEYKYTHTDY